MGDEHGIEVDAYNIEKGEVIKGPASLMYGSDALAGVVSLIPSMPHENDSKIHGKILQEYQNNNGLAGEGFRLNYANNHWAYVLRGSYRIAKNYTNAIDGRVYNTGFRETNASATIKHVSNKGHSDLNFTLYNNLQGIPDGSRDSLTRKFTKQIDEGLLDDIKSRSVVSNKELNSYELSPLHQRIQHYRIYSNSHYELGRGDIDFLLAFQQNIRREYDHPTDPRQAGLFVRLNTVNYGFRYNAPEILNTEITAGINGMYQDNKSKNATDFPIPDYNLLDAGGYVYAKWKRNRMTISGGIRYDIRYLKGNDFYTVRDTSTFFSKKVSVPDTAGAYLQFPSFNKTFNGTSLSLGTTYEINKNISLKGNIASGYRAPNITEFASNGLDPGAHIVYLGNRNFVPEFSLQEDVSVELFYKDIAATVSIFNNNIQNYIYLSQLTDASGNAVVNAQGDRTYQYQQASAQLYGMEISESLHPSVAQGFSFDNALSVIYGYNRKTNYRGKGKEGEYLPLIPPAKLLSSLSQEIQIKSKIIPLVNVRAEMEYNAAQNRFLALNNIETATPSYTLFNFSVHAQINYDRKNNMELQLQVNNVFEKAYQSSLSRLKYFEYYTNSPNGHSGMFNMGRNICFKAIFSF
jgi:iron complex outermembrane recepter protein